MNIMIYDCGLREGAQAKGVSYSVDDKIKILKLLDEMGVSYVEGGNPHANPKEAEFFRRAKDMHLKHTKLCAFGSTCRVGISPAEDENIKSLLSAETETVTIFGKSWDMHVSCVLKTDLETNLKLIFDSVSYLKAQGKTVIFDAEHFFDGYKNNKDYALCVLKAAERAGAYAVVLCDTNGGTLGLDLYNAVKCAVETVSIPVGIHCHNDTSAADANSCLAVQAGAKMVHTCFLGIGERCGNADLFSVVPNLQLKMNYNCITDSSMHELKHYAGDIAEILNMQVPQNAPYVGSKAFSHKAGMHIDAIRKNSKTFEHIPPESVGNERKILLSDLSGSSAVLKKIQELAPEINKNSPETKSVLKELKDLEYEGYQFEGAEASLELLILRNLGLYHPIFDLDRFKVIVEEPAGEFASAAMIKIKSGEKIEITADEGDGPVNALDKALRKALEVFYPSLSNVRLTDFKVRVLDSEHATASKVRVLIESSDGKKSWSTVGVSSDIIRASFKAVTDSLEYYLLIDKKGKK